MRWEVVVGCGDTYICMWECWNGRVVGFVHNSLEVEQYSIGALVEMVLPRHSLKTESQSRRTSLEFERSIFIRYDIARFSSECNKLPSKLILRKSIIKESGRFQG